MPFVDTSGVNANRLSNLRRNQAGRRNTQFTLGQETLLPGQAPRSGFSNEREYLNAANEDSEILNLEHLLAGKPKPTTRVGEAGVVPGLRSSRPGMGQLSMAGEEDAIDRNARQDQADFAFKHNKMNIEDRLEGRYQRTIDAHDMNPEQRLHSGRTAAAANAYGNINREQGMANAQSAARTFMDPTVTQARGVQVDEQERLLTARYGREADAIAKVEAAKIAADARVGAANATAGGGLQREAIRGLLKSREMQQMMGGKPMDDSTIDQLMLRYAQGGEAQPDYTIDEPSLQALIAGARAGGDNSPAGQQLQQYWGQMTPEQQARVRQALDEPRIGPGRR